MAAGSVILTGANGSSGLAAAEHLLKAYPQYTAVFTVRNPDNTDVNTNALREMIKRYPEAKATVYGVDLGDLAAVHALASKISSMIDAGDIPPIKAIICNAFYWNLVSDPKFTKDSYEMTLQISHISHVALILPLLDRFSPDGGRVEMLSSIAHYRRKSVMSPYIPGIPDDYDLMVHPPADPNKQGFGFLLYARAKLVNTIWIYALNRYLQSDPKFAKITAVAMNPGNLMDARCFQGNTPASIQYMQKLLMKPLLPFIKFMDREARSSAAAGIDEIELALNEKFDGDRCYFTWLKKDNPDSIVLDEAVQTQIWVKSAEWAGLNQYSTARDDTFN